MEKDKIKNNVDYTLCELCALCGKKIISICDSLSTIHNPHFELIKWLLSGIGYRQRTTLLLHKQQGQVKCHLP